MSDLLQEYKEYYAVRAKRYANNPNYKNSYEAEKSSLKLYKVVILGKNLKTNEEI